MLAGACTLPLTARDIQITGVIDAYIPTYRMVNPAIDDVLRCRPNKVSGKVVGFRSSLGVMSCA